jgi:UDP-N-acetyl-D-mannosaminuronic acid dehydrogenase
VIDKSLFLSSHVEDIERARTVIIAVGTPVDEYLNPKLRALLELFGDLKPHLDPSQLIVIRSTVYPGTCEQIARVLDRPDGQPWHIAYCPERITQGYAIRELSSLPQIVAGLTEKATDDASALFRQIAPTVIVVEMLEAELVKLFSNAWRYIQFAATNQFYMISQQFGADYDRVRRAMVEGYGRAANLPSAGFAAGPCLLKDTMQLAAFSPERFLLGHAAMMVNEGLPAFIVDRLRQNYDISRMCLGILGMAFKADIDDVRDSLSYKLGKILRFHGARVLYSDEFATDPTFISKEKLVEESDIIIVGVPHSAYRELKVPAGVDVVDLWSVLPGRTT